MKISHNAVRLTLQVLILLLVVLVVLSPVAPLYEPVPARDQGVYLYIGQQVLDGKIPYRDVWDHKGPLVYYINALGLWLTGSIWGVWLIEIIFLFLAGVFSLLAMRMAFNPSTALSSTILWLGAFPEIMDHGSSVEEYSLLFQFATVYFFVRTLRLETISKNYWNEFRVGVTAALAFSLRPNNIGIHLAIGLVLVTTLLSKKERAHAVKQIIAAALGSGVVFAIIAIYFAFHNSLADLFDQVFVFNYYYSRLQEVSWLAIIKGYNLLTFIVTIGMLGLASTIIFLLQNWKQEDAKNRFAFLLIVVVPIQLYLSMLSGRKYMHYYIAWLPILALLVGFLIFSIQEWVGGIIHKEKYRKAFNLTLALGLVLAFGTQPILGRMPKIETLVKTVWKQRSFPQPNYSAVEQGIYVNYILTHTQPGDYVLIWGNASVYNFLSERESPSRFVYTYPFGVPTYVSQEMVDELQRDIAGKKPMIIDATAGDGTINGISSNAWKDLPATQGLIRFIEENYIHVDTVGRFRVWIPKGK
jgi:hypothetical protein